MADFVSGMFSKGNVTPLKGIVEYEELNVYVDHYEDCFDGMFVYDEEQFHIHLNVDGGTIGTLAVAAIAAVMNWGIIIADYFIFLF